MNELTVNIIFMLAIAAIFIGMYFYEKDLAMTMAKKFAQYVIITVESKFYSQDGQIKLEQAVDELYDMLPTLGRYFITKDQLKAIIQTTFDRISEVVMDEDETQHTVPVAK